MDSSNVIIMQNGVIRTFTISWQQATAPEDDPVLMAALEALEDTEVSRAYGNTSFNIDLSEQLTPGDVVEIFRDHDYTVTPAWYERSGMLLVEMVDKTVDAIRADVRADGYHLPIQAHDAASQALEGCNLTSGPVFIRLWNDALEIQEKARIVPDDQKMARISLVDFVGECAKRKMEPGEYDGLLQQRTDELSPAAAANAE